MIGMEEEAMTKDKKTRHEEKLCELIQVIEDLQEVLKDDALGFSLHKLRHGLTERLAEIRTEKP
jgi:hypothetical protein